MADILTVAEIADYLRICPSTVYRMLRERRIPAFKVGGDWRFNREQIAGWIAEQGNIPQP